MKTKRMCEVLDRIEKEGISKDINKGKELLFPLSATCCQIDRVKKLHTQTIIFL